jgi:nitroreductase
MDAGCAVMILLLAVVDEGLSAGFVGIPTMQGLDVLHELLGIPAEVTPVGVIPIGHRAPDVPSPSLKRGRKASSEYIHQEMW